MAEDTQGAPVQSDTEHNTKPQKHVAKTSSEEIDLELKRLQLETAKLEFQERQANLTDMKERLAERELRREEKQQVYLTRGDSLNVTTQNEASAQRRCNHRKGGDGAAGVIGGRGTDQFYAIMVHKFANGDYWVRCLRCGKTWKPPIRKRFKTQEEYDRALAEYRAALDFPTRNQPSGGVVFGGEGFQEYFRELMADVTLR